MEVAALQRSLDPSTLPLERLAGSTRLTETQKVREVARQFETVLVRQILKEGRKTLFASDLSEGGFSSEIYQDMINQQMADSIGRSGGLGLAKALEAQLTHQTLHSPQTGAVHTARSAQYHGEPDHD